MRLRESGRLGSRETFTKVLVASASGVWEERRHRECPRGISPGRLQVKAMRSRLDESEGRCLKAWKGLDKQIAPAGAARTHQVGREFFLAGMYFVRTFEQSPAGSQSSTVVCPDPM